jgi:hypothetical protein
MRLQRFQSISQDILNILKKKAIHYKMNFMGIFGSFARNEQKLESDLDILVDFSETPSLVSLVQIEQDISKAINMKIDLITKNSLNSHIEKQILADVKVIYNENE